MRGALCQGAGSGVAPVDALGPCLAVWGADSPVQRHGHGAGAPPLRRRGPACGGRGALSAGIVQVSALRDISYAEAARHLARRIEAAQELVQPALASEAGVPSEERPANTTLDTTRLRSELGLPPPDPLTAVDVGMNP